MINSISHPAKYNDSFIPIFTELLKGRKRIIDPFSGTGKLFESNNKFGKSLLVGVEIEREWAVQSEKNIQGSSLYLPFSDNTFDAAITSCTYGNRMADTLLDQYKRITYTSFLKRKLHKDNSGSLQWGEKYKKFHYKAWLELRRVLKDNAIFILNIKDHIRAGERQHVTDWHISTLVDMDFYIKEHRQILVSSMGFGENRELRVPFESIITFGLIK